MLQSAAIEHSSIWSQQEEEEEELQGSFRLSARPSVCLWVLGRGCCPPCGAALGHVPPPQLSLHPDPSAFELMVLCSLPSVQDPHPMLCPPSHAWLPPIPCSAPHPTPGCPPSHVLPPIPCIAAPHPMFCPHPTPPCPTWSPHSP